MDVLSAPSDVATCPNCGEGNPVRFRSCGFCGAELRAERAADEIHRYVTVVNSDLKGSTALGERLDPESLREVLTRYFDEMQLVFEAHGGTIEKIIGDAVVAVFGLPVRREDDAIRAVRAAAETMRVLASLNEQLDAVWGVRLVTRTGVSTGDVVVGDVSASQHVLTGETIKVASAMEQNAPPLEVLIAQSTYDLVREHVEVEPIGPITPKGMAESTEGYRVISVAEPALGIEGATADTPAPDGTRHCPNCGEENDERQTFCGMCAAPLVSVAKAQDSRKTVTLVFADPKPRTESGAPPSPEALREVMSLYFIEMKRALERHGGTVEKFIGDAVMAVFGLPVRHEDDAVRALRAALDMQAALPALNEGFATTWGVRLLNAIGVNTGEVIAGNATLGQRLVTGDAVNVAARLEQAAGPAEVIIGDLTYRLAKDYAEVDAIAPLTLKGKAEPVPAYRLLAVRDRPAEPTSGVAPFVGREVEMSRLAVALADAETKRVARMLTVVGDAGVGKSRLVKEFAEQAGAGARVLRGRCLPYGDGITFWPLAEIVREAATIAAEDTPDVAVGKLASLLEREGCDLSERQEILDRVAAAIGLSPAQFPIAELFWGSRRLLEAMGRERPLVVIIDDIHSAEQTFLELLDHLRDEARDSSLVLLCSARNELLEEHAEWSDAHAQQLLVLQPLSDADSGRIIEELLGEAGLDRSVVERITSAAEGNPLFVEQMVSMLIDTGALRREEGRWRSTAMASQIAVPPSIHALLAARFDSLGLGEKQVLEPASVIGLMFPVAAIEELVADDARPIIDSTLAALDRKEFVKPATLDDEAAFKFAHLLVRDTAYGSLLKRARASYHERFVDWAERINAERGRGQEFEEIHGYHLEQAYQYRAALGVIDEPARRLGERAAAKLASAGRRALGRGDLPAAANLLGRAQALLPAENAFRIELMPDLAEALIAQGERDTAAQVLMEAEAAAEAISDPRLHARASLLHVMVKQMGSASVSTDAAIAEGQRDIAIFEAADDHAGLARAWRLLAQTYNNVGRFAEASEAADNIVRHATAAGEPRLAARAATTKAYSLLLGSVPADDAIRRCEELISQVGGDRRAEAIVSGTLSVLHAMRGSFDQARELYTQQRLILEGLGRNVAALTTSINSARVELLAGDPVAAEREARRDYDALGALDETYFRSTVAGMLARALYEGERFAEAQAVAEEARALTADDDFESQVLWRGVAARLRARVGRADEALELTESQLRLAAETASPVFEADARVERAEVLLMLGRLDEAEPPLREALRLSEEKGDLVSAARIKRRLEALGSA